MPSGSKPGERRGGRQKGTPNRKTALRDALLRATTTSRDASPLDFMLSLIRDSKIPIELRLDMAIAAAPFVHARPHAPSRLRTDPMRGDDIENSARQFALPTMEKALKGSGMDDGDGGHKDEAREKERIQKGASQELVRQPTGAGDSYNKEAAGGAVRGWAGERRGGQHDVEADAGELSPLQFLLRVMHDPGATPQQRIKAARATARYMHAPVVPDKMPAVDEYGFAISRTLAIAIKDDWLALENVDFSSKAAPKRAEIRGRQAQRDRFLRCPPNYSPERDVARLCELTKKWRRSKAEETELARVMARITAFEAAFNRSPEGQIQRRVQDLAYRRETANRERNRRVGLTCAEGKELDELRKKYPSRIPANEILRIFKAFGFAPYTGPYSASPAAPVGDAASSRPAYIRESEMEELAPTMEELHEKRAEQKAELIKLRRASGHPDPWDGEAPLGRIYELEARRYLAEVKGDLTPAEAAELQHIARVYPEEVAKMKKMVERRLYGRKQEGQG